MNDFFLQQLLFQCDNDRALVALSEGAKYVMCATSAYCYQVCVMVKHALAGLVLSGNLPAYLVLYCQKPIFHLVRWLHLSKTFTFIHC